MSAGPGRIRLREFVPHSAGDPLPHGDSPVRHMVWKGVAIRTGPGIRFFDLFVAQPSPDRKTGINGFPGVRIRSFPAVYLFATSVLPATTPPSASRGDMRRTMTRAWLPLNSPHCPQFHEPGRDVSRTVSVVSQGFFKGPGSRASPLAMHIIPLFFLWSVYLRQNVRALLSGAWNGWF